MEFENLIRLIEKVSQSELTGLKYEEDGVKLHLTKKQGGIQVQASEGPVQVVSLPKSEAAPDSGKNN